MKLYVKYMVSHRCKMMVKSELKKLNLHFSTVDLGVVKILEEITPKQRKQLKINLKKSGLELMNDKNIFLVQNIENAIDKMIEQTDEEMNENYSDYISTKLGYDYTYLANI